MKSRSGPNQIASVAIMSLDEARLDEVSEDFARACFAAYPDWRERAVVNSRPDDAEGYLEITVPNPAGSGNLLILTDDEEVTVCFGGYHSHFDWPPADDPIGTHNEPMAFIAAVLADQLIAGSAWNGETWCGSWIGRPGEAHPIGDNALAGATTIRLRSWTGAHDADEQLGAGTGPPATG
jgi:hypothetical protein